MCNRKPFIIKSHLYNKRGFTFGEMLLAIAIMAISIGGTASMFGFFGKNFSRYNSKFGLVNLRNDFRTATMSFESCDDSLYDNDNDGDDDDDDDDENSFQSSMAMSTNGMPFSFRLGNLVVKDDTELWDYRLKVISVRLKLASNSALENRYTENNDKVYLGYIDITTQKLEDKNNTSAIPLRPQRLGNIALKVNESNGSDVRGCLGMTSEEFRCITSYSKPNRWKDSWADDNDETTNPCVD